MKRICPTCSTATTDDIRRSCPKCGRRLTVDDAEVEAATAAGPTPADRLTQFTRAYAFAAVLLVILAAAAWPTSACAIIVLAGLHLPILCAFLLVVANIARDVKAVKERLDG